MLFDQSRYREARDLFLSLLPLAQKIADPPTLAGVFGNIANCELRLGHLDAANDSFERALSLYQALGLETERIRACWNIGCLRVARGEIAEGLARLREAKREFERIGARSDAALVTLDIAETLLASGDPLGATEAADLCKGLVESFTASGSTDNALTAMGVPARGIRVGKGHACARAAGARLRGDAARSEQRPVPSAPCHLISVPCGAADIGLLRSDTTTGSVLELPLEPPWWHVVWTTFLTWSPLDPRGDWSGLSRAYSELIERHGEVEMAASLDQRWQAKLDGGAVLLSLVARGVVERSIRELTTSDRVAGDTPLRALAVDARSVQMVIACPREALHQRVGRLKSRTATLLSFKRAAGAGGKGTWSRGFWWARLENDEMVRAIEAFVTG